MRLSIYASLKDAETFFIRLALMEHAVVIRLQLKVIMVIKIPICSSCQHSTTNYKQHPLHHFPPKTGDFLNKSPSPCKCLPSFDPPPIMASQSQEYYPVRSPTRKTPTASERSTHDRQNDSRRGSAVRVREPESTGEALYVLLLKTIPKSITAQPEELPVLMREYLDTMMGMQLEEVEYSAIVGFELLPKLYFMEDKLIEAKVTPLTKFRKFKDKLHEKLMAGLRRHDHIDRHYRSLIEQQHCPAEEQEPQMEEGFQHGAFNRQKSLTKSNISTRREDTLANRR